MRRRTGRSLPDSCPTAPNRSGDGAPAPVHGRVTRLGELSGGAAEKDEADRRVHDHEGQMRGQAVAEERLLRDGAAEEVDPRQLARPEVRCRDRSAAKKKMMGRKVKSVRKGTCMPKSG